MFYNYAVDDTDNNYFQIPGSRITSTLIDNQHVTLPLNADVNFQLQENRKYIGVITTP